MAIGKNLALLKNHFRKHWQERVRVHLDQAGKKVSRRQARLTKASALAPKPLDTLRPIVRAPTIRYNRKIRAGRGFTLAELKAVGLTAKYARTIGISVDHRRQNKSTETFDLNVERLNQYKSNLIIFDKNTKQKEISSYKQATIDNKITQLPIDSTPRQVEVSDKLAYTTLRTARSDKRHRGVREKRAREKAEAEADKKKK